LETGRVSPSASYREQAGRRVNPDHGRNLLAIEGKVQPRADPNFEHASSGSADHLTAIFLDLVLPHDQVEDQVAVPSGHRSSQLPPASLDESLPLRIIACVMEGLP
jgi:hypothetical protein